MRRRAIVGAIIVSALSVLGGCISQSTDPEAKNQRCEKGPGSGWCPETQGRIKAQVSVMPEPDGPFRGGFHIYDVKSPNEEPAFAHASALSSGIALMPGSYRIVPLEVEGFLVPSPLLLDVKTGRTLRPRFTYQDEDLGTFKLQEPSSSCSARNSTPVFPVQADLPDPVIQMRQEILSAALRCDYRSLESLAQGGNEVFASGNLIETLSLAEYWRRVDPCESSMSVLLTTLSAPHISVSAERYAFSEAGGEGAWADVGVHGDIYVWPSIAWPKAGAEEWSYAARVYRSTPSFRSWREQRNFNGFRVGISSDGDWLFFDDELHPYEGCRKKQRT